MAVGELRRFGALFYRAPLPTQIERADDTMTSSIRRRNPPHFLSR